MDVASIGVVPVAILGAIVGSFLNVVIFRLPRGLSISEPRWSFCPHCGGRVPPQYNLPIVGWLVLRGRCRLCRAPISMMYPAVEAASAIVFIMLWDAVVTARVVHDMQTSLADVATFTAFIVLFSGLLACSVMDIESYSIHIQIPLLAVGVGVIAHGIGGTAAVEAATSQSRIPLLPPAICAAGLSMGAGWLATIVITTLTKGGRAGASDTHESEIPDLKSEIADPKYDIANVSASPDPPNPTPPEPPSSTTWRFQPIPILLLAAVVVALAAWQAVAPSMALGVSHMPAAGQRALIATCVLLLMLILASLIHREADQQIIGDLERERPQARRLARREFLSLFPALAAGIAMLVWLRYSGRINLAWPEVTAALLPHSSLAPHLVSAVHALSAAILSAGLGWSVRILGTLGFGKEAFGSGDIYIMCAIGAVGGFWLVAIGFLLASVLALVGVLATSFRKTSRAIPFGPWLALGAFAGLWLEEHLITLFGPLGWLMWRFITGRPLAAWD